MAQWVGQKQKHSTRVKVGGFPQREEYPGLIRESQARKCQARKEALRREPDPPIARILIQSFKGWPKRFVSKFEKTLLQK